MRCVKEEVTWSRLAGFCLPVLLIALVGCPIQPPVTDDADGDGVEDAVDVCPDTEAGAEVDATGCAASQLDADGDGVTDDLDECADTPSTVNVDEVGCPVSTPGTPDTDGDGVADDIDQCADTPDSDDVDPNGCAESQLDDDDDGVANSVDQCPDSPAGEDVDENGCAASERDTDGDGVTDDLDECADTPSTVNIDEVGCPVSEPGTPDTDGDGVPDDIDQCSNTPTGASVDSNGCADSQLDSDNDGVTNDADLCADTPLGATVNADGCSSSQLDSDSDGVTDDDDDCADTPSGETVDANGCGASQLDTDGDGVNDATDACPDTPAGDTVNSVGCTVTVTTPAECDTTNTWNVSGDVLFTGLLEPVSYAVSDTTLPVLCVAQMDVMEPGDRVDPGTVELGGTDPTIVGNAPIEVPDLGEVVDFEFGVLFTQFTVDLSHDGSDDGTGCTAGSVCWQFDMSITTESDLAGQESTSTTHYNGVQMGTLSGDGKEITWDSFTKGTRTITTILGGEESRTVSNLSDVFAGDSLGSWTLN